MQARGEMVLYYNPENGAPARQTALMKSVFVRMGVRIRNVRPEEVNETVGYLAGLKGVCLGSDAFFPFGDNIERAAKSGVTYIAQPGGSIRDDNVIDTCNKYGMVMAMTGIRLFHH